jgi:hypothetical protein
MNSDSRIQSAANNETASNNTTTQQLRMGVSLLYRALCKPLKPRAFIFQVSAESGGEGGETGEPTGAGSHGGTVSPDGDAVDAPRRFTC